MTVTQPIRDKRKVSMLIEYYLKKGDMRNYVLVVMSVYTALRISDLLRLNTCCVYDFVTGRVRKTITLTEKKTGKTKTIALNSQVIKALNLYRPEAEQGAFLFPNKHTGTAISRIQAYRVIRCAAEALNFSDRVSCHSLRKTFGYHTWKNGVSPAVIMEIYNHSSLSVTRRYLGVTQDDKNAAYLALHFTA